MYLPWRIQPDADGADCTADAADCHSRFARQARATKVLGVLIGRTAVGVLRNLQAIGTMH